MGNETFQKTLTFIQDISTLDSCQGQDHEVHDLWCIRFWTRLYLWVGYKQCGRLESHVWSFPFFWYCGWVLGTHSQCSSMWLVANEDGWSSPWWGKQYSPHRLSWCTGLHVLIFFPFKNFLGWQFGKIIASVVFVFLGAKACAVRTSSTGLVCHIDQTHPPREHSSLHRHHRRWRTS